MPNFDTLYQAIKELKTLNLGQEDNMITEGEVVGDWHDQTLATTSLFHYVPTLFDYISILESKNIWSAKGSENLYLSTGKPNSQFDRNAADLYAKTDKKHAYVCFTEHPTKVALQYKRPFGIEFKKDSINDFIERTGSVLLDYDQFKSKTSGKLIDQTKPRRGRKSKEFASAASDTAKYNDCRIGAVGKLASGKCFIKIQKWQAREIEDVEEITEFNNIEDAYNKLVQWFLHRTAKSGSVVHFVNPQNNPWKGPNDPRVLADFADKKFAVIENTKIAWETKVKKDSDEYKEIVANGGNPDFDWKVATKPTKKFKNISEVYTLVSIPDFGIAPNGSYGDSDDVNAPRIWTLPEELQQVISPELADIIMPDALYKILNVTFSEFEKRLYIPKNRDFYFDFDDIKAVWLPRIASVDQQECNFELVYGFIRDENPDFDMFKRYCIETAAIARAFIIEALWKIFNLINAKHLNIEWFTYESNSNRDPKKVLAAEKQQIKKSSDLDKHVNANSRDHLRYISEFDMNEIFKIDSVAADVDDMSSPLLYVIDHEGHKNLIMRGFKTQSGVEASARIGAEAIIIGKDEHNNYYLQLEDKAKNFLELPGGGFTEKPNSYSDVVTFIQKKVAHEVGISSNELTNKTLFDDGIYMYEGKDEKFIKKIPNEKERWLISYYTLIGFTYKKLIDSHELDAYYKDRGGESSKWVPIEALKTNIEFRNRYKNIWPKIEQMKSLL